jgi:hypothetical protein
VSDPYGVTRPAIGSFVPPPPPRLVGECPEIYECLAGARPSSDLGGVYDDTGLFTGISALWPMAVERLNEEATYRCWCAFGEAIGLADLRTAYGPHWPRRPVASEKAWRFMDLGKPAAWSAARRDPVEPLAMLMLGVWPEFRSRGYADKIRDWTARAAFSKWPDIDAVGVAILHSNPSHLARWASKDGWRFVGALDYPAPGESFFIRERGA